MAALYLMEINEKTDPGIMKEFLPLLSSEKRDLISRMRFESDRKLHVYSEVLLRSCICKALSIKNQDIQFAVNEFGKPYLFNHPAFHFNISHTRNAVAEAFGDSSLGVDIEKINPADIAVARKAFTEKEIAYVYSGSGDTAVRFGEIWTKKESYVKWTGKGLPADLSSIDVSGDPVGSRIHTVRFRQYAVSLCSGAGVRCPDIIQIDELDLLNRVKDIIC